MGHVCVPKKLKHPKHKIINSVLMHNWCYLSDTVQFKNYQIKNKRNMGLINFLVKKQLSGNEKSTYFMS